MFVFSLLPKKWLSYQSFQLVNVLNDHQKTKLHREILLKMLTVTQILFR